MLIHREYSWVYTTSFTIFRNRIVAENWNIPFSYGHLDLSSIKPHCKNPTIANVFTQMGIVEGLLVRVGADKNGHWEVTES
jgi:ATP-dependent DNA helicase RecG